MAVLVHGLSADATSWWQIGPALAERGYHVLAPELTGHGGSPRVAAYSREAWAADLVAAVPAQPDLAVGHSLGGVVLGLAVPQLRPRRAAYFDPAFIAPAGTPHSTVMPSFRALAEWTTTDVEAQHGAWPAQARQHRLAAVRQWDPETTAMADIDGEYLPDRAVVPSLVLAADPSELVTPERAAELRRRGFEVVVVSGAGHWLHEDEPAGVLRALERWAS